MTEFHFSPAAWAPLRDSTELTRLRGLSGEALTHHYNPDLKIHIVDDDMPRIIFAADILNEIVTARDEGRRVNLIIPNPNPGYRYVAHLINTLRIDCKHVTTFNLDEWADADGHVADESYPQSFIRATKKFWLKEIDADLRMPESQVICPTTENINHYSELIEEAGGADVSYSGPGWTGHLGFIDPDVPEWSTDLDEFLTQGARITTLHPLTIAQNSLHGSFGASGDLAAVPPKAATIGPADIARARRRFETHALTTAGTRVSWQRMASRLALHGPVTPAVPTSIMQVLGADVYMSRSIAAPIEPDWLFQY